MDLTALDLARQDTDRGAALLGSLLAGHLPDVGVKGFAPSLSTTEDLVNLMSNYIEKGPTNLDPSQLANFEDAFIKPLLNSPNIHARDIAARYYVTKANSLGTAGGSTALPDYVVNAYQALSGPATLSAAESRANLLESLMGEFGANDQYKGLFNQFMKGLSPNADMSSLATPFLQIAAPLYFKELSRLSAQSVNDAPSLGLVSAKLPSEEIVGSPYSAINQLKKYIAQAQLGLGGYTLAPGNPTPVANPNYLLSLAEQGAKQNISNSLYGGALTGTGVPGGPPGPNGLVQGTAASGGSAAAAAAKNALQTPQQGAAKPAAYEPSPVATDRAIQNDNLKQIEDALLKYQIPAAVVISALNDPKNSSKLVQMLGTGGVAELQRWAVQNLRKFTVPPPVDPIQLILGKS